MTIRTNTDLPPELKRWQAEARMRAGEYGLDFFDTIFEVVDFDTMNQLATYGGFPVRYPHWKWGMEYEKLRKRDAYGMGRIYEMVINNDPCYAYLQESNSVTDQKLVMAHVYAHCDFFKCNLWFSQTHRNMMDEMANHATRVQRLIDKLGSEKVEQFLDHCLSIEFLIDPYSMFFKRDTPTLAPLQTDHGVKPSGRPSQEGADALETSATGSRNGVKLPAKDYMDRFINPPEVIRAEREARHKEEAEARRKFPSQPTRDVLLFLLRNAQLEDWQRDILSIIRDESYYFAPQAMTKIMNEGWATYWHSKIMTTHLLTGAEIIDYAQQHSGVVYMAEGGFNPYKIGIEVYKDIEERWNKGQHGPAWEKLEGIGARERFDDHSMKGREKIFQVRRVYNDVNFIDEFLTDALIDRLKLYQYKVDPRTGEKVIASRDPRVIRQVMLYRISNMGQPFIYIVDANYHNRGELYLAHQFNGLEVDAARANEVLKAIRTMWGRPVHLQTRINGDPSLLTCKSVEEEIVREKVNEQTPAPAHHIE